MDFLIIGAVLFSFAYYFYRKKHPLPYLRDYLKGQPDFKEDEIHLGINSGFAVDLGKRQLALHDARFFKKDKFGQLELRDVASFSKHTAFDRIRVIKLRTNVSSRPNIWFRYRNENEMEKARATLDKALELKKEDLEAHRLMQLGASLQEALTTDSKHLDNELPFTEEEAEARYVEAHIKKCLGEHGFIEGKHPARENETLNQAFNRATDLIIPNFDVIAAGTRFYITKKNGRNARIINALCPFFEGCEESGDFTRGTISSYVSNRINEYLDEHSN
ncbi:hypothetical protein [Flexibacterium corallicola]|uniref:hypothetical protein n=1 Tax=Flexibacterium corallicola TaxID=3037259 RepID=UPI00286EC70B|nr:hypothetical protein [Pseudovibrio sp. M1P-2-3]